MLMKCATFSINNGVIRNSIGKYNLGKVFRKMNNSQWDYFPKFNIAMLHNANSSLHYITREVDENKRQISQLNEIVGLTHSRTELNPDDMSISNIHIATINQYDRSGQMIGTIRKEVNLNSNTSLWELLGGEYSSDSEWRLNENSIDVVATLASSINVTRKEVQTQLTTLLSNYSISPAFTKYTNIINSLDLNPDKLHQFMKESAIALAGPQTAFKKGVVNINDSSTLYNDNSLLYFEVDSKHIGVQQVLEHSPEDSRVSEMTQVISALIQRGISYKTVLSIYKNIAKTISVQLEALTGFETQDELIRKLAYNLIENLDREDVSDERLVDRYIKSLRSSLSDKGQELNIPFDDKVYYNKFISDLASSLNKGAIKRKFYGMGGILVPAYDNIGVIEYNGNLYTKEEYERIDGAPVIDDIDNKEIESGNVKIGDWIVDNNGEVKKVSFFTKDDKISIWDVRKYDSVVKVNNRGRNLRGHNYTFRLDGISGVYDGYDLDSSKLSYNLKDVINNIKSVKYNKSGKITWKKKGYGSSELASIFNKLIAFLDSKKSLNSGTTKQLFTKLESYIATDNSDEKEEILDSINLIVKEWVISDCKTIESGYFPVPVNKKFEGIDAELIPITNIEYQPNEMILPKLWSTKFMLDSNISLNDISAEYFQDKLKKKFNSAKYNKDYDILKAKYIGDDHEIGVALINDIKNNDDWTEIDKESLYKNSTFIDNKVYLLSEGKIILEVVDGTRVFKSKTNANGIVIAVDDVKDINKLQNTKLFKSLLIFDGDTLETLKKAHNKMIPKHILNLDTSNLTSEEIANAYKSEEFIKTQAQKMWVSFNNAAKNFISARIPSQSQQSFMNMKIVGFTNTSTNIVYVCGEQLWYQGSDFDIDKAYIMGYSINKNGELEDWSPYFDYSSSSAFEKSMEFPFPTGVKTEYDATGLDITDVYTKYNNSLTLHRSNPSDPNNRLSYLDSLINLFTFVSDNNKVYVEGLNDDEVGMLLKLINDHNLYKSKSNNSLIEALKNKIFSEMWNVGRKYSNIVPQTSPISMKEGEMVSKRMDSFSSKVDNNNPAAKTILQFQNSIGSQGIGIVATGIKIYSTVLANAHSKLYAKKNWTLDGWRKVISELRGKKSFSINGIDIEGGWVNIIPNVNYDNLMNSYLVNDSGEYVNEHGEVVDTPVSVLDVTIDEQYSLRTLLELVGAKQDVFLSISVLLSLATDNAKELILEKINGTPDMLGMYIYSLFRGASFKETAFFMTSPLMNLIKEKSKRNIFSSSGHKNSLLSAINFYKVGPNIKNYISEEYVNSFNNSYWTFKSSLNDKSELKGILDQYKSFAALIKNYNGGELEKICNEYKTFLNKNAYLISKNASKNMTTQSDEFEDDIQDFLDFEDDMDGGHYVDTNRSARVIYAINSFLDDVVYRSKKLNMLMSENNIDADGMETMFNTIDSVRRGANETQTLGRLLSLNQGIASNVTDQTNYLYNLNKSTNDILKLSNDEKNAIIYLIKQSDIPNNLKTPTEDDNLKALAGYMSKIMGLNINDLSKFRTRLDNPGFNLNEFINDEEMKDFYIRWMNYSSEFINILDVVTTVPHFHEMLKAFNRNIEIQKSITRRKNLTDKLLWELRGKGIIPNTKVLSKVVGDINRFISDLILNEFYSKIGTFNIETENVFENNTIITSDKKVVEINLSRFEDRATFKMWFEEKLLSIRNKYNDSFASNLISKTFYNDLRIPYSAIGLNLSSLMTSSSKSELTNKIVKDFRDNYDSSNNTEGYELSDFNGDLTFSDLLYIYELLINRGGASDYSYSSLFKDSLSNKNSIPYKYEAFIGSLSRDPDYEFKYDINDFYMRFLKPLSPIGDLTKLVNGDKIEIRHKKKPVNLDVDIRTNFETLPFTNNTHLYLKSDVLYGLVNEITRLQGTGVLNLKLKCD